MFNIINNKETKIINLILNAQFRRVYIACNLNINLALL